MRHYQQHNFSWNTAGEGNVPVEIGVRYMPNDKLSRLLLRFGAAATAHHEALEAMDEERANTHARLIARLYESIWSEGLAGIAALLDLVECDTPVVAGMAAVYSMDFNPEKCLATLRRLAAEPGLLGFRASVAVERWEAGEWIQPGKQES
jgi:hypothetical protein